VCLEPELLAAFAEKVAALMVHEVALLVQLVDVILVCLILFALELEVFFVVGWRVVVLCGVLFEVFELLGQALAQARVEAELVHLLAACLDFLLR
jgi:hypothetical protein